MIINIEFNDKAERIIDKYVLPAMMAGISFATQAIAANKILQNGGLDVQSCLFGAIALGSAVSAGYLVGDYKKDEDLYNSYTNTHPETDFDEALFAMPIEDPYIFEPSSPYITGLQEPLTAEEHQGHQNAVDAQLKSDEVLYRVGFGRGTITPQEKLKEADEAGIAKAPVGFRMSKP